MLIKLLLKTCQFIRLQLLSIIVIVVNLINLPTSYAEKAIELNPTVVNTPIAKDEFEWQFMVDFSLVDSQYLLADVEQSNVVDYFQLGLLLDMSYKGFFIRQNSRRSSSALGGAEIGYQLTLKEDWQLEFILKTYVNGYEPSELLKDNNVPQLEGLAERKATTGLALRYSHFFDDAIFYFDIAAASAFDDNQYGNSSGLIVDSFYSYLIPYRNWDIYLGAGLTYYSQAINDYYIGINANEVTNNRPLFEAESNYRAQFEIYAQYPLSNSWFLNTGVTQSFYLNNIKKSPLINRNKITQAVIGVLYVF